MAATAISSEYLRKGLDLTQAQVDSADEETYKGYMQKAVMQLLQLLYASNQMTERLKGKDGPDFLQMAQLVKQVVKLQAGFRGRLARNKLNQDADLLEKKLAVQEKRSAAPKEALALQEFKQRLQQKAGLTPEAFFRCCDSRYQKSIPCDLFKAQVMQLNLRLSKAQISRLVLIFDEDLEGNITLQEYLDALEAYNCSGEKHGGQTAMDGSGSYVAFEHKALFKLISILQERRMSYAEVFRSCDINGDGRLELKELEDFLNGLSAEFRQKDVHAIHGFFDLDKNGLCEEKEFLAQIKKAEKLYEAYQKRSSTEGKARPGTAQAPRSGGLDLAAGAAVNNFTAAPSGLEAYMPGYDSMTQAAKSESMVSYLNGEFKMRKLNP